MAVVNTKSTFITNADATPVTRTGRFITRGEVLNAIGTVEVAAADSDTSVFRFVRVPSNARIVSIRIFCDAITGGTSYDCGLYQTAANGGLVLLSSAYASAVDLSSAITTGTEIAFEARDIANIQNKVYQDGGLSSDSGIQYDICLLANTVGSAAGTITLSVSYVV